MVILPPINFVISCFPSMFHCFPHGKTHPVLGGRSFLPTSADKLLGKTKLQSQLNCVASTRSLPTIPNSRQNICTAKTCGKKPMAKANKNLLCLKSVLLINTTKTLNLSTKDHLNKNKINATLLNKSAP